MVTSMDETRDLISTMFGRTLVVVVVDSISSSKNKRVYL